jgi:hypothetical protein
MAVSCHAPDVSSPTPSVKAAERDRESGSGESASPLRRSHPTLTIVGPPLEPTRPAASARVAGTTGWFRMPLQWSAGSAERRLSARRRARIRALVLARVAAPLPAHISQREPLTLVLARFGYPSRRRTPTICPWLRPMLQPKCGGRDRAGVSAMVPTVMAPRRPSFARGLSLLSARR